MKLKPFLEYKEKHLKPTESFKLKDKLNPQLWDNFSLKESVREKLLNIANEYLNVIKGNFTVYDIILTGSLASYNWSKYSDIDLHIIIDYNELKCEDPYLIKDYLKLLSKEWNRNYNIGLYGYEVEIFLENKNDDREHVNGVYSIQKNKWIKRPEKKDIEIDEKLIEEKTIVIMSEIDEIEKAYNKSTDDTQDLKDRLDKIWKKVKKSRRDGISSPDGEYSVGNLIFKYLRRNGYLEKIIDLKRKLIEDKYSLKNESILGGIIIGILTLTGIQMLLSIFKKILIKYHQNEILKILGKHIKDNEPIEVIDYGHLYYIPLKEIDRNIRIKKKDKKLTINGGDIEIILNDNQYNKIINIIEKYIKII